MGPLGGFSQEVHQKLSHKVIYLQQRRPRGLVSRAVTSPAGDTGSLYFRDGRGGVLVMLWVQVQEHALTQVAHSGHKAETSVLK